MIRKVLLVVIAAAGCALSVLFFLANSTPNRPTPPNIIWEKRYSRLSNEADNPVALAIDSLGNVLIAGTSAIVKHDGSNGKTLWIQRDAGLFVVDARDDMYLAGSVYRGIRPGPLAPPFSGPDTDITIQKCSGKTGETVWKKTFGGRHNDTDWAKAILGDKLGNPVVAGFAPDDTRYYYFVAKYAKDDGRLLWDYASEDGEAVALFHGFLGMKLDPFGDVVIASSFKREVGTREPLFGCYIAKLNGSNGQKLWEKQYQGDSKRYDIIRAFGLDSSGNIVVTGDSGDGNVTRTMTAKFAAQDGKLIWQTKEQTDENRRGSSSSMALDAKDDVIVAGYTWSQDAYPSQYRGVTTKYSGADGGLLWEHVRVIPIASQTIVDACKDSLLMIDLRGQTVLVANRWNGENLDYHLLWLAEKDGSVSHEELYDGPAHDHDFVAAAAIMPDGGVVVTGSSSNCRGWLKPFKKISHWLRTGRRWEKIERESNHVNDDDPYNYDFMTVRYPAPADSRR